MLLWLILIPLATGLAAWFVAPRHETAARWVSLAGLAVCLLPVLAFWREAGAPGPAHGGPWLMELRWDWIPQLGVSFHLALDGLSLLLVALTFFLGILSVAASWTEVRERVGFFHLNLLWSLAGIVGVFTALDLFLFFFFWEMMLVPMYFLIALWGHENRAYASVKFFIFTQLSGLLMLVGILALYFIHGKTTGTYTFSYAGLLGTPMAQPTAFWVMLGFFVAFAVKLPAVPLHTWLADAHTEAPTAGSVILAGLLLKTGAYGLIRFAVPLFPDAAAAFSPVAMALGVIGIVYGAVLAFGQRDLKRLVAYSSISHMGFVLLGVFAWNELALQGTVLQVLCHGLSTGGLFILVGALQERLHTRDMDRMGGLWAAVPRAGGAGLALAMGSLGIPGLGNFVGEFLILLGAFGVNKAMAVLATTGLVFATVYSLWMIQRLFHGPRERGRPVRDLSVREMSVMTALIVALLWLGLYPQPVLDAAKPALGDLTQKATVEVVDAREQPADSGRDVP